MSRDHKIDRKQFLTWSLAAAGGVMIGCTSSESGSPDAGGAGSTGTSGAGGATGGSGGSTGSTGGTTGGGGTGGSTGATASCGMNLKITITNNHGPGANHIMTVTLGEITAAQTKVYDTRGQNTNHTHFVQLTAADYAALTAGKEVRKPSCNDEHEHEYIINCVGTDGVGDPNVAGYCGDATNPTNRTCGESMAHTCAGGPYPSV